MSQVTIIHMQGPPEPCVGIHAHHCPECYEAKLCLADCSRARDLEDPSDGLQRGSPCVCDECERVKRACSDVGVLALDLIHAHINAPERSR